ncbi:hypothetical protein GCM10011571_16840 [Marinithermofilum abyssi]|uniref:SIS domain-containing protein n=1 Tax=Marinithermofilum abyssi TaxID=1571185 RepID=A0A8J2VHH1_9BACL|nr:hypothetical protein GCM10011571_16840 [Marinithermofilum abyssi]
MDQQDIRPEDTVIVVSTSGRNPVPIDVALMAQEKGAFVIGITSFAYAKSQPSKHWSGKTLHQTVDLAIDNHVPPVDTLLNLPLNDNPVSFGPASTVLGAAVLNGIFAETIGILAKKGLTPPVFQSGNLEGASEHNQRLIQRYKGRIPFFNERSSKDIT